jgi:carboxypeptidase Taq
MCTCSFDREVKLTKEQSQRKKVLESEGFEAWQKARSAKDYSLFAPKFKEIIDLQKEIAATVNPDKAAYTSALDEYEKGMTSERIAEVLFHLLLVLCDKVSVFFEFCTLDPYLPSHSPQPLRFPTASTVPCMQIFDELKEKLPPLIAAVRASPTPPSADWLLGEYDVKKQAALCDSLCKDLGFDTSTGRLDVSVHPFTCGLPLHTVRLFHCQ